MLSSNIKLYQAHSRHYLNFVLVIVVGLLCTSRLLAAPPSAFLVFSTNPTIQGEEIDPGDVRSQFGCDELIYAIAGFEGIEPGSYRFKTRWTAPNGQIIKEDESQLEMLLKRQVAYLATSLKIQTQNSNTDEKSPFSGEWRVEILYQEKSIGHGSFELAC